MNNHWFLGALLLLSFFAVIVAGDNEEFPVKKLPRGAQLEVAFQVMLEQIKDAESFKEAMDILQKYRLRGFISDQWIENSPELTSYLARTIKLPEEATRLLFRLAQSRLPIAKLTAKVVVEALQKAGANSNARDSNRMSPFLWSAAADQPHVLDRLIQADVDVNATSDGLTALMFAADRGLKEVVERLINARVDLEAQDREGNTALIIASTRGNGTIVDLLIKAGSNVNIQTKDKWTALMGAANHGAKHVIELLLAAGAKKDLKNDKGQTAFDLAKTDEIRNLVKP